MFHNDKFSEHNYRKMEKQPQTSGHYQKKEIASNTPYMSKINSSTNTGNKASVWRTKINVWSVWHLMSSVRTAAV